MDIKDLLKAINKGGTGARKAIEMLHKNYAIYTRQKVSGYFYGKALDQSVVEDVSQEAWIKILGSIKSYKSKDSEHEEQSFMRWLKTICIRTCIDFDRSRKRKDSNAGHYDDSDQEISETDLSAIAEVETIADPDANLLCNVSMEQCVDQAMLEFEGKHEKCYRLIRAVAREKLTSKQLSKLLGVKEGAARQFLSYCRAQLRPLVDPCLDAT